MFIFFFLKQCKRMHQQMHVIYPYHLHISLHPMQLSNGSSNPCCFLYEIYITPISAPLSYDLRQSFTGKGRKPRSWLPGVRRYSKFVINPDRSSDKFPQCHVFWDLVKFPSVILTIGILESLESLSLQRQMIVSLCAGIGGIVRRIL